MSTLPKSEIKAITKLLKTLDISTAKLLEDQLKTFDIKTLRAINNEISLDDIELRRQFLNLVQSVKREQLKKDFSDWGKNYTDDLETGVFYVALFENPFLDIDHYKNLIQEWSLKLEGHLKKIKGKNISSAIINETNHFLFMELGFKGNKESYYDPQNSFIDKVIDRKLGNPILLSVIYLLITKKLELYFHGVNMPAHFLVQYNTLDETIYIDPFNMGEILTKSVCQDRIKTLKLAWQEDYLMSPSNKLIVARIIQNLVNIYNNEGLYEQKDILESYVNILKNV